MSLPLTVGKKKRLGPLCSLAYTVGKKKKVEKEKEKEKRLALWAVSYGLFLLEAFDGSCSAVPHMAYGCPDHVECDRPQPVLGVHG